jgi:acyl-CoA reductase-like NAD-dependent aldehyde dehydrogenase
MNTIVDYKIYCGGKFISTSQILEVINPFRKKTFAKTYLAGKSELEDAISAAQFAMQKLRELASFQRSEILRSIAEKLIAEKKDLAVLLSMESAKPIHYALTEIERAAQTFFTASEECKRIPAEIISLDWTPAGIGRKGYVNYFPAGIVAGISPFNFPLNLVAHKIAPAIAAGCPIILKPSSTTPLSALRLAEIIHQTNLPKGAVSVLPMSRKTGNQLVTDSRLSVLSFTGSPEVGWKMKSNAGKKKVVLELGGNAAVIISESIKNRNYQQQSDIIQKCINGAFAYSGQICIHAQRFFVHRTYFHEFCNEFCLAVKHLKYGDPLEAETDLADMIDLPNALRVEEWIREAVAGGAKVLAGGKRIEQFVEPTVLTETNSSMKVHAEEVFGPVVVVEPFDTPEEAVRLVNDSRFGLQCGVFTDSVTELDYFYQNIEVGGVIHNDCPTLRFDHMPYGGVKDSGIGREGVKYAMMDFLESRILVK